ncbi:MAG: DUF2026 family protein [Gallionellaceae bacterium]
MKNKLPITLPEYERVFRVIHSVSRSLDDRPGASCLFYNTVGALLLEKMLRVKARPVMGAAFFRVDDPTATALSFAVLNDDGTCTSNEGAFHCWVETESHVVDFTAPMYREYLEKVGLCRQLPRKMFQRRKVDMAATHQNLLCEGDYYVQPNAELTKLSVEKMLLSPAVGDLANICLQWFARPQKTMKEPFSIRNDLQEVIQVRLTSLSITGVW